MATTGEIQKTNRIRIGLDKTIYCSYRIVQEVREHCFRLENNVMVPRKGQGVALESALASLARELPDHFPPSAHAILGTNQPQPMLDSFTGRIYS